MIGCARACLSKRPCSWLGPGKWHGGHNAVTFLGSSGLGKQFGWVRGFVSPVSEFEMLAGSGMIHAGDLWFVEDAGGWGPADRSWQPSFDWGLGCRFDLNPKEPHRFWHVVRPQYVCCMPEFRPCMLDLVVWCFIEAAMNGWLVQSTFKDALDTCVVTDTLDQFGSQGHLTSGSHACDVKGWRELGCWATGVCL